MVCNILRKKVMLQIGFVLGFKMSVNERIKGLSLDKERQSFYVIEILIFCAIPDRNKTNLSQRCLFRIF